jgi:hypothetical protein
MLTRDNVPDPLSWAMPMLRPTDIVLAVYLLWRNVTTIRAKAPFVPKALREQMPWYFLVAISIVCILLVFHALSAFIVLFGYIGGDVRSLAGIVGFGIDSNVSITLIFFVELMVFAYLDTDDA